MSPEKWSKTPSPQYYDSVNSNSFYRYVVIHRPLSSQNTESKRLLTEGRAGLWESINSVPICCRIS